MKMSEFNPWIPTRRYNDFLTGDALKSHGNCAYLGHAGVLPQAQLVLRKAMAAQDLLLVRVPLQRAHLPHQSHAVSALCWAREGGKEARMSIGVINQQHLRYEIARAREGEVT